jgi:hypothetical protein
MDDSETTSRNAAWKRGLREYLWFAIFLVCIASLVAVRSHR